MRRTATTLCVVTALAATPAIGVACPDKGGDASAATGKVSAAGNKKKLRRCKKRAYQRYQGPDLQKALKRCKRKYG